MSSSSNDLEPVRGLINQHISLVHFDLVRILPSKDLLAFIENYWIISWDLQGKPDYQQQNLPHANMHLVIDPSGVSGIFGVHRGVFSYRLSGAGRLIGAKFRPGAFAAFSDISAAALSDTHLEIDRVFDENVDELEKEFLALKDPADGVALVEKMLLQKNPRLNKDAKQAQKLVQMISSSNEIFSLEQLCKKSKKSSRSIQRLFEKYVGVSPKWAIDRNRMLAVFDALNKGEAINLTELAHQLGYYDSAHFARTFKKITGKAPSDYIFDNTKR